MFLKNYFKKIYKKRIKKLIQKNNKKIYQERNKLINILNHDIKTPILAQIQALELILKNENSDFNKNEILNEILNSNYFLYEIISNTIFLTTFENEKPKLHFENIDFINEIKDACKTINNFAKNKQQNIIFKSDNIKNIHLNADKQYIKKILLNILSSSISFGFENSDIEINLEENNDTISFYAKNKSIYMTKEKINSLLKDKKNLYDFNQLGMNLNLNIANKLINAHNWDIIADSQKDNSSVFGFVIKK